ncbi:hypothetical protein ON021_21960, partial [Microcoleus sp. HI-ES]|nr:hypothetical protein [Microcoleus sp. HI-ES]
FAMYSRIFYRNGSRLSDLERNTDSEEIATLEGKRESSTSTDARISQPQSCHFFIQTVTKTVKGRSRTLNSYLQFVGGS